jgi:hypothetical protein
MMPVVSLRARLCEGLKPPFEVVVSLYWVLEWV